MKSKDLITLKLVTEGAGKVNVDLNKLEDALRQVGLEAKDSKNAISMLKEENKLYSEELKVIEKLIRETEKALEGMRKKNDTTSESYIQARTSLQQLTEDKQKYRQKIEETSQSIRNSQNMEEALVRTMKVKDMTMNQLSQRANSLKARMNNIVKEKDLQTWNKLNGELQEVEGQMRRVEAGGKKTSSLFSGSLTSSVLFFAGAITTAKKGLDLYESIMLSNRGTAVEFTSVMDGLSASFDYFKTSVANWNFDNFWDNAKKAFSAGSEATKMFEEAHNMQNSFKLTSGKEVAEIEELKTQLRDVNLSNKERLDIGNQIVSRTKVLAEEEAKVYDAALKASKKKLDSQAEFTEAELDFIIVNRNSQKENIKNLKQIEQLEKDLSRFRKNRDLHIEYSAGGSNTYYEKKVIEDEKKIKKYEETIKKARAKYGFNNEEQYRIMSSAVKKFADTDKTAVDAYIEARVKLQDVDIKTTRSLRQTHRLINSITKKDNNPQKIELVQKKELDTQLTNLENAHKKELQLLQETKLKEKQTDEEYKIAVAKSDKTYYDERVKTLENYKKKVSDKKFIADIDKQVVDSTGKSKEQDPIIDQANVSKLGKNRDESLRFEQVGTNELKRTLATREENEKVYALRMQTLDLTSSQNRLEILRQYSKEVQKLDIADARLKEELVREANDAVIVAETDAIQKRKALDKSYFDSNKETRERYGKVTISEEKANELAILQAYYNAGLISLKTFEESKIAITRKYEEEKLQVREQYNIASVQELYDQELEQLRQKLEQELLTEEEFEQAKWQLKLNYATEFAQKINQLTSTAVNMGNALQEAATAKLEAEYQVRIAAAQGNAAEQERLEQELAEKKLEIEKEYADVQFAIKASEIISSTAVAIMVAYKQLGPIMGSVAAAMLGVTGAAQLVSANAERQKVKSLTLGSSGKTAGSGRVVVGLESGGYMDVTRQQDGKNFRAAYNPSKRGYVDKPTVIVGEGRAGESLEYVIPNKAMKNPTLRPIIDLIDHETRKGTIGTVDMNQMIRGRLAGFESGGAIDSSASTSTNNVPMIVNGQRQSNEVDKEMLELLRYLKKNGVFTNLSLGSVKSGLDTMDKQDNKFRFGDK